MTEPAWAVPAQPHSGCVLCAEAGGVVVASGALWRVVRVKDVAFPAFYRVVWTAHVAEFSMLSAAHRNECIAVVCAVELALLQALRPAKVNLAALGNVVPHLHWHVIARFEWDTHYPQPVWASAQRAAVDAESQLAVPLRTLDLRVAASIAATTGTATGAVPTA